MYFFLKATNLNFDKKQLFPSNTDKSHMFKENNNV